MEDGPALMKFNVSAQIFFGTRHSTCLQDKRRNHYKSKLRKYFSVWFGGDLPYTAQS